MSGLRDSNCIFLLLGIALSASGCKSWFQVESQSKGISSGNSPFYVAEFSLIGQPNITLEGHDTYVDPGAIAWSSDGRDLSSQVKKSITRMRGPLGDLVDILTIQYSLTDDSGVTRTLIRRVNSLKSNVTVATLAREDDTHEVFSPYITSLYGLTSLSRLGQQVKVVITPNFKVAEADLSKVRFSLRQQNSTNCEIDEPVEVTHQVRWTSVGKTFEVTFPGQGLRAGVRYLLSVENVWAQRIGQPFSIQRSIGFLPGDVNHDGRLNSEDLDRFISLRLSVEDQFRFLFTEPDLEMDGRINSDALDYTQLDGDQDYLQELLVSPTSVKQYACGPQEVQCDLSQAEEEIPLEMPFSAAPLRSASTESSGPPPELGAQTLALFNANTDDGYELAMYYAEKRGLPLTNVCALHLPPGQYATLSEVKGARSEIHQCICNLIDPSIRPIPCGAGDIEGLARTSPIAHLVFIGNLPERLTQTGWTSLTVDNGFTVTADQQEPILDYYLSGSIYSNHFLSSSYLGERVSPNGYFLIRNEGSFGVSSGGRAYVWLPPISPREHKMVAYGRIQSLSPDGIKRIIDQTVQSERTGHQGNFYLALATQGGNHEENRAGSASLATDLSHRLLSSTFSENPSRLKCTLSGEHPGAPGSSEALAINAGLYLGQEYLGHNHASFDGRFETLLHWRKDHRPCVPLCRSQSAEDRLVCEALSSDPFREIDTRCVGVNPSFIGWQYRSWPVQYYGLFPSGWSTAEYGFGEKTPPKIMSSGGANRLSPRDRFIRYGSENVTLNPTCKLENGSTQACRERFAVNLHTPITLPQGFQVRAGDRFRVRFSYRNSKPGVSLNVNLNSRTNLGFRGGFFQVNPTEVHSEWTSVESIITMQSDFVFGYTLSLGMSSGLGSLSGLFDLDEVRLTLLPRSPDSAELELLDGEIGSFNKSETLFTNPGDWAAVMIERLGGLGFWGNAQHHSTGGHGFAASQDFLSTFLSGRTAGEALLQAGRNESGLVYLDPLYRPQGVKIYLENGLKPFQPGTTIGPEDLESQTHLKLNAFLGRGETHWRLSACVSKIEDSNHSPECRVIRSGENAIYEYDPKIALQELLIEDRVVQQIKLKLTVFRPGDEAGAISDSAVYQFVPNQQVKTDTIAY